MDTAQSVGAQAGGFSFDSCVRNKLLEKTGLKAPTAQKTGTTIVGVVYKVRSIIIYTPRAPWRDAPGAEADPAARCAARRMGWCWARTRAPRTTRW